MKSAALSVDASEMAVKVAKGSYAPSINLNAGISTGWNSATGTTYFDQLGNKLGESVGLSLSLPIFNGKQVRTSSAISPRPACSSAGIRPEKPPASIRLTR